MPNQVLARKYRPHSFAEMVGQEPILKMLVNALTHQRLHHAYLFTGTRGVGKTTLARILAKCLNCEAGISATPCGTCSICTAIDAGRFLDLIEVDAASRTKVEDTREILDNVQYAPTQGRFKIYLIDEVHMLSGHSFNALLKTLEEPPAHVKFLLATTDPKRLPITILSRCLQFNLKRVPQDQIAQQLKSICEQEKIPFELPALSLIANAADGSMRDALSLLDQVIAFCDEKINVAETSAMLGNVATDRIYNLLKALAANDGATLLTEIKGLSEYAPDFQIVLAELLATLHQINVTQVLPSLETPAEIKNLAMLFSAEEVQLFYQIALMGRKDLPYSPNPQLGFEMVMLRMLAFRPTPTTDTTSPTSTNNQIKNKIVTVVTPIQTTVTASATTESVTATNLKSTPNWSALLSQLQLTGMAQALAANCTLLNLTDNQIDLALAPQHEPMLNKKLTDRIEAVLSKHFNKPMKLAIQITSDELHTPAKQKQAEKTKKHQVATATLQNDDHVKTLLELFDATLDINSVKAVDPL